MLFVVSLILNTLHYMYLLQTQLMYKWVDPKVCRDGYSESIKLPPSGRPEKCPPCNPGMASTNMTDHRCVVCPRGHYSDGSHPCIKCPPVTEAVYNIDLQFWPNSDSLPHFVTLDCVSDAPGYCVDSGWEFLSNFIGTNLHNNPTAVPQLTIHTIGFRGSESVVTGGEMSIVGHVRFVFETECEHKCEFRFLVVRSNLCVYVAPRQFYLSLSTQLILVKDNVQ